LKPNGALKLAQEVLLQGSDFICKSDWKTFPTSEKLEADWVLPCTNIKKFKNYIKEEDMPAQYVCVNFRFGL